MSLYVAYHLGPCARIHHVAALSWLFPAWRWQTRWDSRGVETCKNTRSLPISYRHSHTRTSIPDTSVSCPPPTSQSVQPVSCTHPSQLPTLVFLLFFPALEVADFCSPLIRSFSSHFSPSLLHSSQASSHLVSTCSWPYLDPFSWAFLVFCACAFWLRGNILSLRILVIRSSDCSKSAYKEMLFCCGLAIRPNFNCRPETKKKKSTRNNWLVIPLFFSSPPLSLSPFHPHNHQLPLHNHGFRGCHCGQAHPWDLQGSWGRPLQPLWQGPPPWALSCLVHPQGLGWQWGCRHCWTW